jgi:hypothetical protein
VKPVIFSTVPGRRKTNRMEDEKEKKKIRDMARSQGILQPATA